MASKPYRGHKSEWNRDEGSVPGHPIKHPGLLQMGQSHTPFDSRGFHEDRGHNTRAEKISLNRINQHKETPNGHPVNVQGGHDPRPEHFHKNSGCESGGHQLVRRGGSVISGMNRGLK